MEIADVAKKALQETKAGKLDPNINAIDSPEKFKYAVISKIVAGVSWGWTVWNLPDIIRAVLEILKLVWLV